MPVVRWIFYDPSVPETWTMDINPREGGSPSFAKTINYENTAAPDGKTLIFEGRDEVQRLEWQGVILTQAHYDTLEDWWDKRRQVRVTDDLSRQFWVYITHFEPRRRRAYGRPYKHDYTMRATILSWA